MKLDVVVSPSKTVDSQVSREKSGKPKTQEAEQEKGVVTLGDELFDDENVGGMVVRLGREDVELAELASAF